jgi:head-tail adaptor
MRAGSLRDRVRIEERIVTGDDQDGHEITWAPLITVDCDAQRLDEQSARFIVRYRAGVTPASHRLIWDGCIWTIVSAPHDKYRTILTIECNFSNLIEATHLTSTETEYIDAVPVLRPRE